jgi:hypothetical protein
MFLGIAQNNECTLLILRSVNEHSLSVAMLGGKRGGHRHA